MTERLLEMNRTIALQVRDVLDRNLGERHIRGGRATSLKYRGACSEKKNNCNWSSDNDCNACVRNICI